MNDHYTIILRGLIRVGADFLGLHLHVDYYTDCAIRPLIILHLFVDYVSQSSIGLHRNYLACRINVVLAYTDVKVATTPMHSSEGRINFHSFPCDPYLCEKWIRANPRKDFKHSKTRRCVRYAYIQRQRLD